MQTNDTSSLRPSSRANLSTELQQTLRRLIIEGQLPPTSRLNEVALSAELQVSRTPLREALAQLVSEGFVDSIPRRGFFVAPLSAAEVRELYPIRQLLDPEALRIGGLPSSQQLARLDRLNQRIGRETQTDRIIDLDDRWHLQLVAGCPNATLLELIRQFMRKTRRYELAYLSDGHHVTVATDEHQRILDLLGQGELDAACTALRQNMTSAVAPLVAWLEDSTEETTHRGTTT